MFFEKRPLDGGVPSVGSILFTVFALPAVAAVANSLDLPRGFQIVVIVIGLTLASVPYAVAARASARRRGTPFVTLAEAQAYLSAWAVSQPVWRVFLLAVAPLWIGWTLFMVQYLAHRPLWRLSPADWRSITVSSLLFGTMWTVAWFCRNRRGPKTDRAPEAHQSTFLRL